jgi:hypothetical protein
MESIEYVTKWSLIQSSAAANRRRKDWFRTLGLIVICLSPLIQKSCAIHLNKQTNKQTNALSFHTYIMIQYLYKLPLIVAIGAKCRKSYLRYHHIIYIIKHYRHARFLFQCFYKWQEAGFWSMSIQICEIFVTAISQSETVLGLLMVCSTVKYLTDPFMVILLILAVIEQTANFQHW